MSAAPDFIAPVDASGQTQRAMSLEVRFEELRGRIKGVEKDQSNHEEICAIRYGEIGRQQGELKSAIESQATARDKAHIDLKKEVRADISGIKTMLSKWMWAGLAGWAGVTGWALKSQWEMQQDTTKALIQMQGGAPRGQTAAALPMLVPSAQAAPQN